MRVCKDLKWGLIDFHNNIIAPIKYDQIGKFGQEMHNLAVVIKGEKIGFINKKGEEIIPVEYDEIGDYPFYPFLQRGPYYRTKLDNKYGYVTGDGVFCEPIFENAGNFVTANYNNDIAFKKIGKYAKVKYKNNSYLLDENGMLYTYKHFLGIISSVDLDSGFRVVE